jgi:23S rRNA pseudouridine1911/1915/1917 synthase
MGEPSGDQGSVQLSWRVEENESGLRLDGWVRRRFPHLSWREARRLIAEGRFLRQGRRGKKGERLAPGERVSYRGPEELLAPAPLPGPAGLLRPVFENSAVIVLEKPAGIASHGFSARDRETVANALLALRPELREIGRSRWEAGLVHRLDRETSGLMIAAKTNEAFWNLRRQFASGEIEKRYRALVWGEPPRQGTIGEPLAHDRSDRRKMAPAAESAAGSRLRSWPARTRFRTLASAGGFSLLEIELETGVTHQIRVHLASRGHPIVGDPLYGRPGPLPFPLRRQFLHASGLGFIDPETERFLRFRSPLPADLRAVLEMLKLRPD